MWKVNDRLASAIASLDEMKSELVAIQEGRRSPDFERLARLRGLLRTRVAQAIDGYQAADDSHSG